MAGCILTWLISLTLTKIIAINSDYSSVAEVSARSHARTIILIAIAH
ncbi:hypothetical protein [Nostoc sp. UHCC 0252]|nr:hypothetical protein [Nostoc sp. UHCC 0252]MEA5600105.1 hypothetical protein [Nostoc sp. UHCC 0252]